MEQPESIKELIKNRKEFIKVVRSNGFDFDSILAGLYQDPSHFVYEIIQNAEDAGASSVTFQLFEDRLEIVHNGAPFSLEDINAITGIGITTKKDDLTSNENRGKTAAVLLRTNRFEGLTLPQFEKALRRLVIGELGTVPEDRAVEVRTVHSYKGLEKDLIIILDVNESFPLLHPDNNLFRIFGRSQEDEFMEEKRLFYVAVTRAKQSLYILTEKDNRSVFVERINHPV